jgi:Putative transposase
MFRGKFLAGLGRLFTDGKLAPSTRAMGLAVTLAQPAAFARLKEALYQKQWNVYAKAPFGNPRALFRYLGLYTHRVAISNHRLLHVDDDEVVFRTRDQQICRLPPLEFMRRFLQHVLPRGFVKIRHFGLLAAGNVNTKLAVARAALEQRQPHDTPEASPSSSSDIPALDWRALFLRLTGVDLGQCPHCGGHLVAEALVDTPRTARAPPPESA